MAISRKYALKRLRSFFLQVEEHLEKIASNPGDLSQKHWMQETRNWLQQMEEMLPHVGKKTASEWQTRIEACRSALEG